MVASHFQSIITQFLVFLETMFTNRLTLPGLCYPGQPTLNRLEQWDVATTVMMATEI